MANQPPQGSAAREQRAFGAIGKLDPVTGAPERAVFGIMGYFLPDTSVVRRPKFQHLLAAKFFADMGRDSVRYASLVGVIYLGGGAFASSLIGIAALIPGIIFALYGGAISDSLPKRVALAGVYLLDAALCLSVAFFFDDTIAVYFMLVFLVTSLTQIASPAEQTLVPLVNTEAQLATANSVMGMVSSIGTAAGTAFMAPILLHVAGTNAVFVACAVLLLLAMTRIVQADSPRDVAAGKFVRPKQDYSAVMRWLFANRSIMTMIGVSAVGGMGYQIISTLAPTFVYEVLDTDPANTVFVMGMAGVGMTLSLFIVPPMIKRFGERVTAGVGFLMLATGLVGLGLINQGIVDFLNVINPIHWLVELFNIDQINEKVQLAMFISLPVGFGMGLTDNSVKTYLNRRVPVAYQGRAFAIRNLSESALTIIPLLGLAALATWTTVSLVLFIMPAVFYVVILGLLRLSAKMGTEIPPEESGVFKTFWEASDDEEISSMSVMDAPKLDDGAAS